MPSRQDPGSTIWFSLSIDGQSLGYWNGCEGLSSQVEVEQRQEGGNNGFVWQLPTRITFSNVRLTRPLTPDTTKVAKWISSVQTGIKRPTGTIVARRADGSEVARWGLLEVLPVSWQGPSFDPGGSAVATEVLEIAHHGFTD
ncbi:phage tail protein [Streptomyces griseoviridis]|jgi:phage tail-like protein|uniref:Phage tail-like protein n=3 Tax=Streptomyces TaxID=1883 RepID=A0ABT9LJE5_STRGD|nr:MULTISPECIES: phage tail protein [Streptomyces]MDP9682611.1 phage tail-like protein [Streptomyces griseoviridis]GGS59074.1 phage tail protein [Streptomyces niveoruber]GGT11754.1 phage tail protein [Streptomyces griseoviridis]GGU54489.1 phage tail protein [Streptomyces daghestanicus]GHI32224.1 phage tail protein [Streptomyces daghestanicus]